jgi:hypothetical protein
MLRAMSVYAQVVSPLRASLLSLLVTCLVSSCTTWPKGEVQRALYADVKKALAAEKRLGWTVDRVEIAQAAAEAEPSLCRVEAAERLTLKSWVTAEITRLGGASRTQYEAGKDIDDLSAVIDLERANALLDEAEHHLADDCPYWLRREPTFAGIHSTAHRFVVIVESVGGASLFITEGKVRTAGGGAARVLPSVGFGQRWQLATGFEAGGDAVLEKGDDGNLAPAGAFRMAIPAVLRLNDVDRIYDLELAAVSRFKSAHPEPWGARVALAGGVSGLRRIGFMPAIQLWLGYELYPAQGSYGAQHVLRMGTRVGLDWDP